MASLLAACSSSSDGTTAATTASGAATFEDADSDASGEPREPATPPPQPSDDPMRVWLMVEGSGSIDGVEPECTLDETSGQFEGVYRGEASVDDGLYLASFASSAASFETASGCEIPDLEIAAFSEIVVRGELRASATNCQSYCQAKARSAAETQCNGDSDQASCRSEVTGEYQSSCETRCVSTDNRIVAESRLSSGSVADVNANSISGAAVGDLAVDLTFDRIEDGSGETVEESP